MKLIAAVVATVATLTHAYSSHWEAQIYEDTKNGHTTKSMWVFAQDGIHIYSASGDELLVRHDKGDACHAVLDPWSSPGTIQDECWHMDPIHDGENYVFVGNNDWTENGYVDVFSMWTGRKLTSIAVCSLPYHMEYSPNRREVWVACWLRPQPENTSNETDAGTIEVIQTQALGAIPTSIDTHGFDAHHHSDFVIDASIPDKAYEFTMENSTIYEIDPGSKVLRQTIQIPKTVGIYEHAYSPVNKHLYIRTYGCCSCGEFKDTREPCEGWEKDVIVEFGPNASPDPQPGICNGKFCKGSLADVNGLWEFDTQTNTHVAQHFPANDAHGAKPFASSFGDYILIGSGDGGNAVKVLKPGKNGEASTNVGIINLDFGADVGQHAFSDVDFMEGDNRNIAIFTSTLNNHVVLVDMSDFDNATAANPASVNGVDLDLFETEQEDISVKHDIRGINIRQIRWAVGTDYVWVSSPLTEQVHVIKLGETLDDAKVVRTLDEIDNSRHFLWVHNFEEDALMIQSERNKEKAAVVSESIGLLNNNTETAKTFGIIGIVLSCLALFISIFNLANSRKSGGISQEKKVCDANDDEGLS